jgi:hypothetical protein
MRPARKTNMAGSVGSVAAQRMLKGAHSAAFAVWLEHIEASIIKLIFCTHDLSGVQSFMRHFHAPQRLGA